jgi:hypothetical protein
VDEPEANGSDIPGVLRGMFMRRILLRPVYERVGCITREKVVFAPMAKTAREIRVKAREICVKVTIIQRPIYI